MAETRHGCERTVPAQQVRASGHGIVERLSSTLRECYYHRESKCCSTHPSSIYTDEATIRGIVPFEPILEIHALLIYGSFSATMYFGEIFLLLASLTYAGKLSLACPFCRR